MAGFTTGAIKVAGVTSTPVAQSLMEVGVPRHIVIQVANGEHPDFIKWSTFIARKHGADLYGDVLNEYAHLYNLKVPDMYVGTRAERRARQKKMRFEAEQDRVLQRTAANLRYKAQQRAKKGGRKKGAKPVEINRREPGRIFIKQ